MLGDLLSNGGSKGDSPWLRRNVGGGTGPVMPDRQGVEPLGNELLVNEMVMIPITKLRSGSTFERQGEPWRVMTYKHVHLSRGSGTITIKARNLKNGNVRSLTFRSGERIEEIDVERRVLTYLYKDGEMLVFMDPTSFEQSMLPVSVVGNATDFLAEGQNVTVLVWDEQILDIELAPKVTLTVSEASPGVKGDTVAGATKDVVLENGKSVRVPLFIKKGEKIVVDTRTGEYVERAS